jgi:hypothetical protein
LIIPEKLPIFLFFDFSENSKEFRKFFWLSEIIKNTFLINKLKFQKKFPETARQKIPKLGGNKG